MCVTPISSTRLREGHFVANPAPLSPFILVEPAFRLSLLWWEMYWAAAETIGYRLGAMALAGERKRTGRLSIRIEPASGW